MGWRAVRRSIIGRRRERRRARRAGAGGVDELLVVVRGGRPPADVDEHGRARVRRHRAGATGHPGQRHRHRRRGHARAARTPAAARSRRTSSTAPRTASGSCSSPRAGSSSSSPSRSRSCATRSPRPTTRAERDPRDWTLQGSNDGTDLDDARHAAAARTSRSASRPRSTRFANDDGLPPLPARHHRQPRRRRSSSSPSCSSPTATQPAAGARHAQHVGAGPRGGYNAKSGVGFTGVRALQYAGAPHQRGPRLLLQQGLRRRRRGHAPDRAVVPDLSRLRARRPQLPEHVRRRRPRLHRRHLPQRPAAPSTSTARR